MKLKIGGIYYTDYHPNRHFILLELNTEMDRRFFPEVWHLFWNTETRKLCQIRNKDVLVMRKKND